MNGPSRPLWPLPPRADLSLERTRPTKAPPAFPCWPSTLQERHPVVQRELTNRNVFSDAPSATPVSVFLQSCTSHIAPAPPPSHPTVAGIPRAAPCEGGAERWSVSSAGGVSGADFEEEPTISLPAMLPASPAAFLCAAFPPSIPPTAPPSPPRLPPLPSVALASKDGNTTPSPTSSSSVSADHPASGLLGRASDSERLSRASLIVDILRSSSNLPPNTPRHSTTGEGRADA
jgi:hypothetical protein